jgi:hypothetical protein
VENGEIRKEDRGRGKKKISRKQRNLLCAWKEEKRKKKNLSDVVGKWEREKKNW